MSPEEEKSLKDAEINYSAVWRISREVFTKKASEILNVPIERVEVLRSIANDSSFGLLSVVLYDEKDELKQYYHLNNKSIRFSDLPTNIYEFEEALKTKVGEHKSEKNKLYMEGLNEVGQVLRDADYEDENLEEKPTESTDLFKEIIEFREAHKNYPSTTHTLTFNEMLSVIEKIRTTFNVVTLQIRKDSDEVHIHISNN